MKIPKEGLIDEIDKFDRIKPVCEDFGFAASATS
jgi:hypothetical protein